jgi:O-antigen/teichoic acid export membrane protein
VSIARKALVGAIWASGANYLSQGVGFIALAILGRLLLEADFGLFATANSIVQFIFILSAFSFNLSIIQCNEQRNALYSTALIMITGLSLASLFLTAASVFVYSQFRVLTEIEIAVILSLACANILNLFGQLFDAILQRNLEFKKTSAISFVMNLTNPAVAITLAFLGAGIWSMVAGQVAASVIFILGGYLYAGWRPTVDFDKTTARWFLVMGWKFMGSRALEVVYTELDRLVVKSMNSYAQVGLYDRAAMAARYPARVVTPAIINVALPVYSRLKGDAQQLSDAYTLVNYFLVRTLLPFGLIFLLIPDAFMVAVLGGKWIHAAPVLKILAVYAVLHPMVENFRVLFYSLGRPEVVAKVRVLQIIVYIPTLIGFVAWIGIEGAAWSLLVSIIATYIAFGVVARNSVRYPLVKTITVPAIVAVLTVAVFFLIPLPEFQSPIVALLIKSVIITAIFVFFEILFEGRTLLRHLSYFRGLLGKKRADGETEQDIDNKKKQSDS